MKRTDKALLIIFTAFVLIIGSLIFILPQKDFSDAENRYLAKAPELSIASLLSGEYAKGISSFYTDQFPLRTAATSLYAICERSVGKNISGGVISYGEQLISISKKEMSTKEISIPAVCVDSKYSLFKAQSDELLHYYNTDHHRKSYGAYLLYLEACEKLKVEPYPESYFTKETVCTDFYGTDFFKSRLPKFTVSSDSIELWRYPDDERVTFTIHDTKKTVSGFYDLSKLDTADKYAVFLGGNYSYATVFSSSDKPTLLLFKDSFANAVIPFLSLHFNIDLIDPRYATSPQISTIYSTRSYDAYLFIGCIESFN